MIRALITSAFLVVAGSPVFAIEITETTSPGGVKAWLVEDHSIPFMAMTILFKGGASLDAEGKRGAIKLMTSTLAEGAGDMNATAFAEKLEALGTDIFFDVDDDALLVSYLALTENRDDVADLLNTALTKPRFDADRVQIVRSQIEMMIRSSDTDPNAIAVKAISKMMWGDHPYGSMNTGTLESVGALTRDDLVDAKNRVIAKDKVIVSAAGDITAQELGVLVDRILDGIPAEGAPDPVAATYQLKGGQTVIPWDSPQTVVQFAQPGIAMDDPDYYAAVVANYILGNGGFSSRLMEEIREKRGLTYGVGTGLANGLYGDSWQGALSSANDKVVEANSLVSEIWGKFRDGVSDKELHAAKAYLTGEYSLRFDGNGPIASILAGMQLSGLPADYVNTRNAKVAAVTKEDIHRVAQQYLDPEKLHFVLVGQPEGLDAQPQSDAPAEAASE